MTPRMISWGYAAIYIGYLLTLIWLARLWPGHEALLVGSAAFVGLVLALAQAFVFWADQRMRR